MSDEDKPQERRYQEDRRAKERQGKYDRRRNRCGRCHFFQSPKLCKLHDMAVTQETYACIYFEAIYT